MEESETLVLPSLSSNAFLVNPDYEPAESEEEKRGQSDSEEERHKKSEQKDDRQKLKFRAYNSHGAQPRSKFVIGSKKESAGVGGRNDVNGSFIPKTVTSGSPSKPRGFARNIAETRSKGMLTVKQDPNKRVRIERQLKARNANEPVISPAEKGGNDNESESIDSGIASGEKSPTIRQSRTEPEANGGDASKVKSDQSKPNDSARSSNRRVVSPIVKRQPTSEQTAVGSKRSTAAQRPANTHEAPKENTSLKSNDSRHTTPRETPSKDQGLFYDKHGNLVLRDKVRESTMTTSDTPGPKLRNTKAELTKVYIKDSTVGSFKRDRESRLSDTSSQRREPMLTRREAETWDHIHGVYGQSVERTRLKRHHRFLSRLERLQLDAAQDHNRQVIDEKIRSFESKQRQQMQLWLVRSRFQEEQERRFYNQWVTMKTVQHEKCDRHQYGLPEDLFGPPENPSIVKRKKKRELIQTFDYRKKREENIRRYQHLLDINTGANFERSEEKPKVEPPDNVDVKVKVHSGHRWKEDDRKVKEIMREAKREIRAADKDDHQVEETRRGPRIEFRKNGERKKEYKLAPRKQASPLKQAPPPLKKQAPPQTNKDDSSRPIVKRSRQNVLESPETKFRDKRIPSLASLKTVDFINGNDSDTGSQLDAFERARIKYNLYMDSEAGSDAEM